MKPTAMDWLETVRGLDAELCDKLGFQAGNHSQLGEGVKWPYVRNGEAYAHKFRPFDEKTFRWHPREVEHGLFNEDVLRRDELAEQPLIICEGEFDAVSCIQAGYPKSVSIPDGWSEGTEDPKSNKLRPLVSCQKLITGQIIVAADNDGPGISFARAVANLFEDQPVRIATWPEGCKDANDVLRKHGGATLASCLNAAKVIGPPGGEITGFSDLPPLSTRKVWRIGHDPFDRGLAFEQCTMSVSTGIPGSGKSTFVRWAMHHVARTNNVRIGLMDFEAGPYAVRDHLTRLHTGRPWNDLNAEQQRGVEAVLDGSWRIAHGCPDDSEAQDLEWVRRRIRHLAVIDGCSIVVIDPWNELEHLPEPGESLTNYINFALKKIRQWAERYDCHVHVVAHPKKISADNGGNIRIPEGYDIADSAAWANKPSLGFTVHQAEQEDGQPIVKIRTWKVRNVQAYGFGRGTIGCEFDQNKMVYRRLM